jgi:hypothetical protein
MPGCFRQVAGRDIPSSAGHNQHRRPDSRLVIYKQPFKSTMKIGAIPEAWGQNMSIADLCSMGVRSALRPTWPKRPSDDRPTATFFSTPSWFRRVTFHVTLLAAAVSSANAAELPSSAPTPLKGTGVGQFLNDLLPIAWQKRPKLRFNVFTEMTVEGRKRREPTPTQPLVYFAPPGTFEQPGWMPNAGEKPPPWPELQEAMQKALAANGYVPTASDQQRPDLLIVFTYGSHGTEIAMLADDAEAAPTNAEELLNWALHDSTAARDVIQRARFIGGERVARELSAAMRQEVENARTNRDMGSNVLPVNPDAGSPFQLLLHFDDSEATRNVVELAFHTCYFVTATAFDFSGVEKKQKIPLWQTRMTIEAQGVALDEVLKPLIVNTGSFLGRETPESVVVAKRIEREGRVQIGETKVISEKEATESAPKK